MSIRQGKIIVAGSGGGTGGTSNYIDLENKPSINGVILEGNKTTEELLIEAGVGDYTQLTNKPSINGVALEGDVDSKSLNIVPIAVDEYININNPNIILDPHAKIYYCEVTNTDLTITLDYSNMPSNFKYYSFELDMKVNIGLIGTITFNLGTFPVQWEVEAPTLDSMGIYNLVFKTYDGGEHWIGNLAYFIPSPTNESTLTLNFKGAAGTELSSKILKLRFNNKDFTYRIKNQVIPESGTFSVSFKGLTGNSYNYQVDFTTGTDINTNVTLTNDISIDCPIE